MTPDRKLNDDTREMATVKTILNHAALRDSDPEWNRALQGIQARADLGSAKAAASLLTTEGMTELSVWLEGQIGRRNGF